MNDPVTRAVDFGRKRKDGRHGFAGKTQVAVWVVLDDKELVLHRQLQQCDAALARNRCASGVCKRGDRVEQLRSRKRTGRKKRGETGDVDAVRIDGNRNDFFLLKPQCLKRRGLCRLLSHHDIARTHQHAKQQVESLLRSGCDQHLVRLARYIAARHQLDELVLE